MQCKTTILLLFISIAYSSAWSNSVTFGFANKIGNTNINSFNGSIASSNTGDFKLYTRKALDRILAFDDKDPFVRGLSIVTGLNQGVIKYERHPRSDGKTGQSLISSFDPYEELFRGLTFNSYNL